MEYEKLLPCPFCGGKAEIRILDRDDWCHCDCTKCHMGSRAIYKNKDKAIEDWNKRVSKRKELSMLVRYFEIKNKKDLYQFEEALIVETINSEIIPHRKETVIINDIVYKVCDVCYSLEFTNDGNQSSIGMIDVTIIEIENKCTI